MARVALVTGGTRGIGAAISLALNSLACRLLSVMKSFMISLSASCRLASFIPLALGRRQAAETAAPA